MAEQKPETGYNERDLQIAIALGLGYTKVDAAKAVYTLDSPQGVSERTVHNRVATNGPFIEQWQRFTASLVREQSLEVKEVTAATAKAELEKLLAPAIAAIRTAIQSGDAKTAESLLDRVLGKATQTNVNLHAGRIDVVNYQMPTAVAAAMDSLIAAGRIPIGALAPAPPLALEAEVVE